MIIVTGSLLAKPEAFDEVLRLSQEHVLRSRSEAGCVAHAVLRDSENPLRLVFLEEWTDESSLMAHFAVPGSRAFAKSVAALVAAPPTLNIYDATPIRP